MAKKCSKCSGFMRQQEDHEGTYFHCLMCGKYEDIKFHLGLVSSTDNKPPKTSSKWSKSTDYYNDEWYWKGGCL